MQTTGCFSSYNYYIEMFGKLVLIESNRNTFPAGYQDLKGEAKFSEVSFLGKMVHAVEDTLFCALC